MEKVDEFIDNLLKEKGITDVDPDVLEGVKNDMKEQLLKQIDREAIMRLPEEKANELADKLEDPSFTEQQMAEFIQNSGVNLPDVVVDVMIKFRGFYLGTGE